MFRPALVCLLCFTSFSLAQSSPVQVVYVIDGSTLTTYDIDPQTLYAIQVGALTLPESTYPYIVPSPNGHFLYYTAYNDPSGTSQHLWVYATDASGAPQAPAVQEINANGFYLRPSMDPPANSLYVVHAGLPGPRYTTYTIRRYLVNPNTGKISQPVIEAQYQLSNGSGGSEYCGLFIDGFNATGNEMYDEVNCGYHGGSAVTYNERTVNLQSGALGPDVQVYSWNNSTEGGEYVQFVKNLVFDFVLPNNYQQGVNSLNIYPLQPDTATPLLECTASMLEACGYAGGVAHPSGKYVFMGISQDSTQIDKVELSAKKIVDTSNYIPYRFGQFSPDGSLVYGLYDSSPGYYIEIYGFNVNTGAVVAGGIIGVPSAFDPYFVAERY
jgi:hypothetical protein